MLDLLRRFFTVPPKTETIDSIVEDLAIEDNDPRGIGDADYEPDSS